MTHSPGPWRWDGYCFRGGPLGRPIVEGGYDRDHDTKIVVSKEDAALIALAPQMAELLTELEWSAFTDGGTFGPCCPMCHGHKDHGHMGERVNVNQKPPCRLNAVLRSLRGEP